MLGDPVEQTSGKQALKQAIQQDRLPAGTTRECPPWWRLGNSLDRTDIDVETDMVESGAAVKLKKEPLVDGGLPDAVNIDVGARRM